MPSFDLASLFIVVFVLLNGYWAVHICSAVTRYLVMRLHTDYVTYISLIFPDWEKGWIVWIHSVERTKKK